MNNTYITFSKCGDEYISQAYDTSGHIIATYPNTIETKRKMDFIPPAEEITRAAQLARYHWLV